MHAHTYIDLYGNRYNHSKAKLVSAAPTREQTDKPASQRRRERERALRRGRRNANSAEQTNKQANNRPDAHQPIGAEGSTTAVALPRDRSAFLRTRGAKADSANSGTDDANRYSGTENANSDKDNASSRPTARAGRLYSAALAWCGTGPVRHWPGAALARCGTGPVRHWPGAALA